MFQSQSGVELFVFAFLGLAHFILPMEEPPCHPPSRSAPPTPCLTTTLLWGGFDWRNVNVHSGLKQGARWGVAQISVRFEIQISNHTSPQGDVCD